MVINRHLCIHVYRWRGDGVTSTDRFDPRCNRIYILVWLHALYNTGSNGTVDGEGNSLIMKMRADTPVVCFGPRLYRYRGLI